MSVAINATDPLNILKDASDLVEKHMSHIMRRGDYGTASQHCLRVATELANGGESEIVVASAMLHDILEDTDVTHNDLRRQFGREIAHLVVVLTKNGNDAKDIRHHLDLIRATGRDAVLIKLADNADNLASPKFLKNPARYLRYAAHIQKMGREVLGDHPLVLKHLTRLREAELYFRL